MNPAESSSSNQNDDTLASKITLNVEMFIVDVFARPDIWNRNFERNALAISNLWIELATKHNRTVEELKKKWTILREKFRQELKKIPRHVDNSYVINPRNIISNWRHYRSMLFMVDQITLKPVNEIVTSNLYQQPIHHLQIDNFHAKQEPIDASGVTAEEIVQPDKREAIDDASISVNKRRFDSHEVEYDDLLMKRRKEEDLCDNKLKTEDLDVDDDHSQDNEVTHEVNNEAPQEPHADHHCDNQFLMIITDYVHHVDHVRKLNLISQIHNILLKEIAEML